MLTHRITATLEPLTMWWWSELAVRVCAAKILIDDGYDVLIIEATDRIGGRVKNQNLGDIRVELGAGEHYFATGMARD